MPETGFVKVPTPESQPVSPYYRAPKPAEERPPDMSFRLAPSKKPSFILYVFLAFVSVLLVMAANEMLAYRSIPLATLFYLFPVICGVAIAREIRQWRARRKE